jgi:hypothetical protein
MNRPHQHPTAERLAADAAALVRTSSPGDWPGGFVVVADRLPRGVCGLAFGSGEGLASVYGVRLAARAVLLDPWKVAANPEAPTTTEVVRFEAIALHEAAHTLTMAPVDAERVAARLDELGTAPAGYSAATLAGLHPPRWAVAYWLLASRAANYRRATRSLLLDTAARDVAVYGYQRADLEQLAHGVATDEPLASRLVAGGAWDTLLSDRLPDESTRTNAIVAAGVSRGEKEG